jgi:hypothetical protein
MENLREIRELGKLGLETYLEEYEFLDLEKLLNPAIEELYLEARKIQDSFEKAYNKDKQKDYSELSLITSELFSIEDKILSIYEMIIVNDYKEFELVLKRLLKASLDFEEKNFRSFDNLKPLLKSKEIVFSEIKNYREVNELRKVNNYIKHSTESKIPNELKQIIEFRGVEEITFLNLKEFHNRIKKLRYEFILDLKNKIYSYLYEYNEERINSIAIKMLKRMDEKHIEILLNKLSELN